MNFIFFTVFCLIGMASCQQKPLTQAIVESTLSGTMYFSWRGGWTSIDEDAFQGPKGQLLTYIAIQQSPLTSLPKNLLSKSSKLWTFDVAQCQISTIPDGFFAGVPQLTELNLQGNKLSSVSKSMFAGLPSLVAFRLAANGLTAIDRTIFASMPELSLLDLSGNQLTSWGPIGVTKLTMLYLQGNKISSLPDDSFTSFKDTLIYCWIGANPIKSISANLFKGQSHVVNIDMTATGLTTIPANAFADCSSLQSLGLGNNSFHAGINKAMWNGLSKLQHLGLQNCQITALPADAFTPLTGLTDIALGQNLLTSVPETIFSNNLNLASISFWENSQFTMTAATVDSLPKLFSLDTRGTKMCTPLTMTKPKAQYYQQLVQC